MTLQDLEDPLSSIAAKYDEMISLGWATQANKTDVLAQEAYFDANRTTIQQSYPGKFVAIANQQVFASDTLTGAEAGQCTVLSVNSR